MAKRMKAAAASISVVGGAVVALMAGPAGADRPAGTAQTCPASYEATTLPALIALGAQNGVPQDRVEATFARVNKNEDPWICVAVVPQSTGYNFIDNAAVGLDR